MQGRIRLVFSAPRFRSYIVIATQVILIALFSLLPSANVAAGDAFLPLIAQYEPSQWTLLGTVGERVTALEIHGDYLYIGDDGLNDKSLHRANIIDCTSGLSFAEAYGNSNNHHYRVYDIDFQGNIGLAATFDIPVIYSNDGGENWHKIDREDSPNTAYALIFGDFYAYAGTETDGVAALDFSNPMPRNWDWSTIAEIPEKVNRVSLNSDTLWIGSHEEGVWSLDLPTGAVPTERNIGLPLGEAQNIWDFEFQDPGDIFVATEGGVFRKSGAEDWQAFGLDNHDVRTLEFYGGQLFAGTKDEGVWQTKVENSASWSRVEAGAGWNNKSYVRDLLNDQEHCDGLLAATDSGVWLWR
jgi:hypothetical protein